MTRTITAHGGMTATVDVRALTISGRQVTLSVFRQLKDEALVDEDTGQLRGVPWGIVNYFWGECAKSAEHLHVVWQKGDQLRRACCWPKASSSKGWRSRKAVCDGDYESMIEVMAADHLDGVRSARGYQEATHYVGARFVHNINGRVFELPLKDEPSIRRAMQWTSTSHWDAPNEEERARRRAQEKAEHAATLREMALGYTGTSDASEIQALLVEDVRRLNDFEREWAGTYATLADLDHLFIAV